MTSPPPPPRANRAPRLALLGGVGFLVIGGLVALVVLVPGHEPSPPAPSTTPPATAPSEASPTVSSSSASISSTAPASPSPVPSLGGLVVPSGDPQAALKASIAAAFVAFNDVVNDMSTTKTADFTPLTEVAADPLYTAMEDGIVKLYNQGELEQGRATLSNLTIKDIGPDGASATLTACADVSHTRTINATTGVPVGPAGSPRIVDAATLRIRDGRWKVTGLTHPGVC